MKKKGLLISLVMLGLGLAALKLYQLKKQARPFLKILTKSLIFKPSDIARLKLIGRPHERYQISVYLPTGAKSQSGGIDAQAADHEGVLEWQWQVGNRTKAGLGRITIKSESGLEKDLKFTILDFA